MRALTYTRERSSGHSEITYFAGRASPMDEPMCILVLDRTPPWCGGKAFGARLYWASEGNGFTHVCDHRGEHAERDARAEGDRLFMALLEAPVGVQS